MAKSPICYGRFPCNGCTQETYETASRDAGRRARALRNLGFRVVVSAMGPQVTRVGKVKLTQLTIADRDSDGQRPPHPETLVRL